jgi:hypothetical protein
LGKRTQAPPLVRLASRLTRAKLSYGRPIEAHGRTVVPVARVHLAGGFGSGDGDGGHLESRPIGYIEIGPEGTRFERIEQPNAGAQLAGGAALLVGAAAAITVARRRGARLRIQAGPARRLLGR